MQSANHAGKHGTRQASARFSETADCTMALPSPAATAPMNPITAAIPARRACRSAMRLSASLAKLIETRYGTAGVPVEVVLPDGGRVSLLVHPDNDG